MRLIYSWLAFANLRPVLAAYGRAEVRDRFSEEALARARAQVVVADSFDQRAGADGIVGCRCRDPAPADRSLRARPGKLWRAQLAGLDHRRLPAAAPAPRRSRR